jgi:hypothetical protein
LDQSAGVEFPNQLLTLQIRTLQPAPLSLPSTSNPIQGKLKIPSFPAYFVSRVLKLCIDSLAHAGVTIGVTGLRGRSGLPQC